MVERRAVVGTEKTYGQQPQLSRWYTTAEDGKDQKNLSLLSRLSGRLKESVSPIVSPIAPKQVPVESTTDMKTLRSMVSEKKSMQCLSSVLQQWL